MSDNQVQQKLKEDFHQHVKKIQDAVCQELQKLDPTIKLIEDNWTRKDIEGNPGGGGITRVFSGDLIENAGVNTSLVHGKVDPKFAAKVGGNLDTMWAAGVSLIIHPMNPKMPTTHANFRMIEMGDNIWFGGGADLTPYYPYTEDFKYFHKVWKDALGDEELYQEMKKTCDTYFTNTHRNNEMRGIGGIFYDHLNTGNLENDYKLVKNLSEQFITSYFPIATKRMNEEYNDLDTDFQLHRRGRYVEFNLLHDRGTKFGLESNGRTDSILVSLPKRCNFSYQYSPEPGTPHAEMMKYYYPCNWT